VKGLDVQATKKRLYTCMDEKSRELGEIKEKVMEVRRRRIGKSKGRMKRRYCYFV